MTTMISNLPRDLIEEILSRIPWKSVKVVRSTCKSWNDLCKSESFTKMHFGKAKPIRQGETMMIAMTDYNLYLMSVNVGPSIELIGQLRFLHNQVIISDVFTYEGLVLCILKDITRIRVWNPYLGQTRWIELRCSHHPHGWDMFNYTLGYGDKDSCRNVKLLRFVDCFNEAPERQFFWYEIYDFDSGLWKTLDVTPHWGVRCSSSVSIKGNTYWDAVESSYGHKDYIICFDFTREKFGPLLPLPSGASDCGYAYENISCVKEENLAAIFQHQASYKYEFEIWITTKIDVEMVSWSKLFKLDTDTEPKIEFTTRFFIDEEKKLYMGFNSGYDPDSDYAEPYINIINEAGDLKKKVIGVLADQKTWPKMCFYVPSLVQIKKPA